VVVTGGARGLGLSMLTAFCQAGAEAAAIIDILDEGTGSAKQLSTDYKIPTVFHKVDVRDHEQVAKAIDSIAAQFGRIDVLLAAAGIAQKYDAHEYPADDFKRIMDVNLNGVFFAAQAAGRHMIAQKTGGSIVAIGSLAGHIVIHPDPQCVYNASKAAVIHLCKSLAAEWAPHKIRVNTISPGYMDTKMTEGYESKSTWTDLTPLGRMGDVTELNGAALYLASDASSYATGTDIIVDGGYTIW